MAYRLGYLGPEGTFSEEACKVYQKNGAPEGAENIPFYSHQAVFDALKSEQVKAIMTPLENSEEGPVTPSWDFLVQASDLGFHIEYELILPVDLALMARPGVTVDQIIHIYSHPQPLEQSRRFIYKHYPKAKVQPFSSTALAAAAVVAVAEPNDRPLNNEFSACVGPKSLAEKFNLNTLAESIQDNPNNSTRFGVVGRQKTKPTGNDKTSLAFAAKRDVPGSLVDHLAIFKEANINLTSIMSRPAKTQLGDYWFFIDLEGHIEDETVVNAVEKLKSKTTCKYLGSYPKAAL